MNEFLVDDNRSDDLQRVWQLLGFCARSVRRNQRFAVTVGAVTLLVVVAAVALAPRQYIATTRVLTQRAQLIPALKKVGEMIDFLRDIIEQAESYLSWAKREDIDDEKFD